MANNLSDGDVPSNQPQPAQAREALESLAADGPKLAEKVVTPWWYYPILGVPAAAATFSFALEGTASVIPAVVAIIVIPILIATYRRRYGVTASGPAGARSWWYFIAVIVVLILAMVAGIAIKNSGVSPWWVAIPALVTFAAVIVLGGRYDDALRRDLTECAGRPR